MLFQLLQRSFRVDEVASQSRLEPGEGWLAPCLSGTPGRQELLESCWPPSTGLAGQPARPHLGRQSLLRLLVPAVLGCLSPECCPTISPRCSGSSQCAHDFQGSWGWQTFHGGGGWGMERAGLEETLVLSPPVGQLGRFLHL